MDGWKALLLLSGMIGSNCHAGLGIPGVISFGGDGGFIKVGPQAEGTNISLPKCGGAICNGLEHLKNEVNGEAERQRAQDEADQAARDLAAINAQVSDLNKKIAEMEAGIAQDKEDFKAFKAQVAEQGRALGEKYQVYVQDQAALEPLLQKALASVLLVRKGHAALSKGARASFAKLSQALAPEAIVATQSVALGLEDIAQSPDSPIRALREAVESFRMVGVRLDETAAESASLLGGLSSEEHVNKVGTALNGLEKSILTQSQTAPDLLASIRQSQQNVENISRQVSATN